MKFVNVRELKNRTSALLHSTERGGDIVVTLRGKPCAVIHHLSEDELEGYILRGKAAGISERVRSLLGELKEGLTTLYGKRLKGVYLYGSYARGQEDRESDIDVLVVLDDFKQYGAEVDRTSRLGASLSLKFGVSISKIFLREREWLKGETPFLLSVRKEAIPA